MKRRPQTFSPLDRNTCPRRRPTCGVGRRCGRRDDIGVCVEGVMGGSGGEYCDGCCGGCCGRRDDIGVFVEGVMKFWWRVLWRVLWWMLWWVLIGEAGVVTILASMWNVL